MHSPASKPTHFFARWWSTSGRLLFGMTQRWQNQQLGMGSDEELKPNQESLSE